MRVTFFAFSLFLTSSILAGTWEAPRIIKEHSIQFVSRDKNINYVTITFLKSGGNVIIMLQHRNGSAITFTHAMTQLINAQSAVNKLEPRMQNFIGLVKKHLGSR